MEEIPEKELAYVAGLFDGEGAITICYQKSKWKWRLRVSLSNTYKPVLDWVRRRFSTPSILLYKGSRIGTKPCFFIQYGDHKAGEFLRAIEPYTIIKRHQILIALEFRETFSEEFRGKCKKNRIPEHLVTKRMECVEKLKEARRFNYV
jgi:hypothetical protein